jgi:hypothetical protein
MNMAANSIFPFFSIAVPDPADTDVEEIELILQVNDLITLGFLQDVSSKFPFVHYTSIKRFREGRLLYITPLGFNTFFGVQDELRVN